MLHLYYEIDASVWRVPMSRRELHDLFSCMQKATGLEDYDVELTLCNDASIARVNADFLGCEGPTNILSFPQGSYGIEENYKDDVHGNLDSERPILGALLLSVDTLIREAFLYGQDEREHCIRLLAHGLGHIAGYDHGPEMEAFEVCARAAFI